MLDLRNDNNLLVLPSRCTVGVHLRPRSRSLSELGASHPAQNRAGASLRERRAVLTHIHFCSAVAKNFCYHGDARRERGVCEACARPLGSTRLCFSFSELKVLDGAPPNLKLSHWTKLFKWFHFEQLNCGYFFNKIPFEVSRTFLSIRKKHVV